MAVDLLHHAERPTRARRAARLTPAVGYASAAVVSLGIWAALFRLILG